MAAMSVLGTGKFSRRLTTRDVVVLRPCSHAATFVGSWGRSACRCATTGALAWSLAEPGFIICRTTVAFGSVSYPWFARAVRT